jgi:hypothetical protein
MCLCTSQSRQVGKSVITAARQEAIPQARVGVRDRAARGVVLVAARTTAARICALAANIVLARMLVPSEFGAVAFGLAIVNFAAALSDGDWAPR